MSGDQECCCLGCVFSVKRVPKRGGSALGNTGVGFGHK